MAKSPATQEYQKLLRGKTTSKKYVSTLRKQVKQERKAASARHVHKGEAAA